jgi:hypothetical protein
MQPPWITKMDYQRVKPSIIAVHVHPQLSHNGHPVDGALVDGHVISGLSHILFF